MVDEARSVGGYRRSRLRQVVCKWKRERRRLRRLIDLQIDSAEVGGGC